MNDCENTIKNIDNKIEKLKRLKHVYPYSGKYYSDMIAGFKEIKERLERRLVATN